MHTGLITILFLNFLDLGFKFQFIIVILIFYHLIFKKIFNFLKKN